MTQTQHGGQRDGAGRKPLAEGITRRLYSLTPRHVALLEQYRQQHALSSSSKALRHMLEAFGRDEQLAKGHDYQLETERRMGVRQQEMIERLRAAASAVVECPLVDNACEHIRALAAVLGRDNCPKL